MKRLRLFILFLLSGLRLKTRTCRWRPFVAIGIVIVSLAPSFSVWGQNPPPVRAIFDPDGYYRNHVPPVRYQDWTILDEANVIQPFTIDEPRTFRLSYFFELYVDPGYFARNFGDVQYFMELLPSHQINIIDYTTGEKVFEIGFARELDDCAGASCEEVPWVRYWIRDNVHNITLRENDFPLGGRNYNIVFHSNDPLATNTSLVLEPGTYQIEMIYPFADFLCVGSTIDCYVDRFKGDPNNIGAGEMRLALYEEVDCTEPPLTVHAFAPSNSFCEVTAYLQPDTEVISACEGYRVTDLTYRIRGDNGLTSRPVTIENPSSNLLNGVLPLATFQTGLEKSWAEVVVDYTVSCSDCEKRFSEVSQRVRVFQPTVRIDIVKGVESQCTVDFSYDVSNFDESGCQVTRQRWNFGDGKSSDQQAPIHEYGNQGDYTVTLSIDYECPSCTGTLKRSTSKEIRFQIPDPMQHQDVPLTFQQLDQVIETGAANFASAWPTYDITDESASLHALHPYANGAAGVWRVAGTNVYNSGQTTRSRAYDLSIDGTVPSYEYNWQADALQLAPNWLRSNTVTGYNLESQEIENKDVLSVYSAALFGYGGDYAIAVGTNASNQELASTSFEDVAAGGGVSGNFLFTPTQVNVPYRFRVISAKSNVLVIDEHYPDVEHILSAAAHEKNKLVTVSIGDHVMQARILCSGDDSRSDGSNPFPGKSVVVLDERVAATFVYEGTLSIPNFESGVGIEQETTWGHTGTTSMKVTASRLKTPQPILRLTPRKAYRLAAWVSIAADETHYEAAQLADDLSISWSFERENGEIVKEGSTDLVGTIVEGWQQVEGKVEVPEESYDRFYLTFTKGSASVLYVDDLRLFPFTGNMQSYVYDLQFRLSATLDENNYATFYDYDEQGQLFLVRKETNQGIRTLQQTTSNQKNELRR
ncbi:MAG: PKD domain-containing protein [Bacteroidota bacterium]